MEYRHLRFFIAVAEELNFTRAAARLRVAQPHLSREIRTLEDMLGVALLTRDKRRVALTPAGDIFLVQARHILAETAETVRMAQRASRGETGRIRVGFASSAGFGMLPDAIRRFRLQRPDVELTLAECNSDEQVELLRTSALDVSFLYPPRDLARGLEAETLLIDPLVAALPEGHRLADKLQIGVEELADEPWILFQRAIASRLYDEILHACSEAGFTPHVVQEGVKLATIASLVASGLGVCLVPVTVTRLRLPRFVWKPLRAPVPKIPLTLMWRGNDPNPSLDMFVTAVREEARRFASGAEWRMVEMPLAGGDGRGTVRPLSRGNGA